MILTIEFDRLLNTYIMQERQLASKSNQKIVQNVRHLLGMRFRLTNQKALQLKNGKTGLLNRLSDTIANTKRKQEQLSKQRQQTFSLKFLEKLNEDFLLIGNEYQLNAIGINCMNDFIEVDSQWNIAEEQLITNIYVSPKVKSFFVICTKKLYLYWYNSQNCEKPPVKQQTFSFSEEITGVYVVKRAIVLVFLQTKFQVFEINFTFKNSQMSRKRSLRYFDKSQALFEKPSSLKPANLQMISVPDDQGSILQIFFKDVSGAKLYEVYSLKIQCLSVDDIQLHTLHKFCEVPQRYVNTLQISHYKSDIYLVYVGLELYAVRNNYFLDNIITNTSKLKSFIKEIGCNFFFLFHKDKFQFYRYELNEKVKPQRFEVECLDSIPLSKPEGSHFFDVKKIGKRLVFVFQQSKSGQYSQLCFWMGISDPINISQKIEKVYPTTPEQIQEMDKQAMQQKIGMAIQIGYAMDVAYLQLWNRSSKSTKKDYDILIATKNYEMIAGQIESKFKKETLKFRQVKSVMIRSLNMLTQKVLYQECSIETMKQFSVCHFLLCKYQMWQKAILCNFKNLNADTLTINIQEYTQITQIQLFKYFYELIAQLFQQKNQRYTQIKIKALLHKFALIARLKLQQIIPKLIRIYKKDILTILQMIPELLPIETDKIGFQGIACRLWSDFSLQETEEYLLLQNYINFQNKSVVEQFIKSKFFKVYQWHSHGALSQSKCFLQEQLQRQNAQFLFTLFYKQLLVEKSHFKKEQIDDIILHIQQHYILVPHNLRGRFHFYEALYTTFERYHRMQRKKFMLPLQFLKLSEDQLFQMYFREQRDKKGIFLLKQIKPIYDKIVTKDTHLFLDCMFRFFKGNHSSWSDLKIILNKFNNQKQDFHRNNSETFQVIVNAILQKVKIGGQNDEAGLSEVISYLQNIPFAMQNTQLLQKLIHIQEIYQEENTLKQLKLNMNLREILQNGEQIIYRMVEKDIQKYKVKNITEVNQLKLYAYKILTQINYRRTNIYVDKHQNFALKCFLIILMEDQAKIQICRQLFVDDFLVKTFKVDQKLLQNIVIYLYRKRLSINPIYQQSVAYINSLVNLLPQINVKRHFLQFSQYYAAIFTSDRYKMRYPFFKTYYPTVDEVARVIKDLGKQQLEKIDQQQVFELILKFKAIGEEFENIKQASSNRFANHSGEDKLQVMKHQFYTVFFMRFINVGLIKEKSLSVAEKIIKMNTTYKIYNIIIPIFLIQIAAKEMIDQVSEHLFCLASYFYNDQNELHELVKQLFVREKQKGFTNQQLIKLFKSKKKEKSKIPIFDPNNQLFSLQFRKELNKYSPDEQAQKFNPIFENIWLHIRSTRQEYTKSKVYSVLYRLILHNPYLLAEYINRKETGVNVRSFRAFLTLIGAECIFDFKKVLQFGEKIFSILLTQWQDKILLEDVMERYARGEKFQKNLYQTDQYLAEKIRPGAEDLMGNSIITIRNKIKIFEELGQANFNEERLGNMRKLLQDPISYFSTPLNYPFNDKDKDYAFPQQDLLLCKKSKKQHRLQFNDISQRSQQQQHINYFVLPAFKQKQQKVLKNTLSDFFTKFSRRMSSNHINRLKSMNLMVQNEKQKQNDTAFDFGFLKALHQISENSSDDDKMKKSQSLRNLDQIKIQKVDEDVDYSCRFIDFLPEFKGQLLKLDQLQILNPYPKFKKQIVSYFQKKTKFNVSQIPNQLHQNSLFYENLVQKIYQHKQYSLARRIQLLLMLKKYLFGLDSISQQIQTAVLRLGKCKLIKSILCNIEDIFSCVIFIQEFTQDGLLQLIRQNISDYVLHQQDYIKLAEIVGYTFNSIQAKQGILMMFMVKLCRQLIVCQSQKEQNHLKDEILLTRQNIKSQTIQAAINNYSSSRNQDLKTTAKVLQYFKNYHHTTNHHSIREAILDIV